MKRLFVIQEHNAKAAGLHWDIRFEDEGVLKSWAVPKHRLPKVGEQLLAMPTEDHPWSYRDFDGVIESGYGAGTVKLIYSDYIEVSELTDTKAAFTHDGGEYRLFNIRGTSRWLITRKK